jgi:cytochrome P450
MSAVSMNAIPMNAEEIFIALLGPAGREDPYPFYARLHELGEAMSAGPGAVLVTGYDAINSVLRDPAYLVQDAAVMDETVPGWRDHPSMSMDSILNLNPPAHAPIRSMVTRAFTARRIAGLQSAIKQMVEELLDAMAKRGTGGGQVEFMHDFAFLLPATVICELIGIPEADRESFRPIGRDLTAVMEFGADDETLARANAGAAWLDKYFTDLASKRRAEPRDDLITALVEIGAAEHGGLSNQALLANLTLLLVAGFETTTNLLGNGLHILLADPRLADAVRRGSIPVASFVEEVLRYDAPVQLTGRRRLDEAQIRGVPVGPGDEVILMLGAGNRDGRRFPDPDTFDPRRAVGGPLSFGAGAHFCAGAALARLEAAIAFPRLLARFPELAAAGEPKRRDGLIFRGFDALPVNVG